MSILECKISIPEIKDFIKNLFFAKDFTLLNKKGDLLIKY